MAAHDAPGRMGDPRRNTDDEADALAIAGAVARLFATTGVRPVYDAAMLARIERDAATISTMARVVRARRK